MDDAPMRYVLGGLTSATLVGVGSILIYGPGAAARIPWVEPLFWSFMAGGAALSLVQETLRCKLCALRERLSGGQARCAQEACLAS